MRAFKVLAQPGTTVFALNFQFIMVFSRGHVKHQEDNKRQIIHPQSSIASERRGWDGNVNVLREDTGRDKKRFEFILGPPRTELLDKLKESVARRNVVLKEMSALLSTLVVERCQPRGKYLELLPNLVPFEMVPSASICRRR
ncbi:hypothetical protein E4U53_003543 [Claviceps sorghi]|nr:hypothetical protein E4U53_003543 [Claviceps sorghi]